jgi:hypothetical protein
VKVLANLEGNDRLARPRGHRQKRPSAPLGDGLDSAVDGNFLVVAGRLAAQVIRRRQDSFGGFGRKRFASGQARPKFRWRWEHTKFSLQPGDVIKLDDAVSVRGVGKIEPQYFGVLFCLLEAVTRRGVIGLGLDHCDGEIRTIAKDVI